MDPLTAWAQAVTAVATMITTLAEGATPEQKAQMFAWYIQDVGWWRKFFHLDPPA